MAGGESKNDRNAKNSAERSSVKYIESVIHFLPAKTNKHLHSLPLRSTNKQTNRQKCAWSLFREYYYILCRPIALNNKKRKRWIPKPPSMFFIVYLWLNSGRSIFFCFPSRFFNTQARASREKLLGAFLSFQKSQNKRLKHQFPPIRKYCTYSRGWYH